MVKSRNTQEENNRSLSKDEKTKISLINTIKNSVLVLAIFFILIFQFQWFLAVDNIEVKYDFSNYNKEIYDTREIDDYFNSVFSYLSDKPINISEVEDEVLKNETLMDILEDKLKFTIKTLMYDESHENFATPIGLVINKSNIHC